MKKQFTFAIGVLLGLIILLFPLTQFQATPLNPIQTLAVQLDGRKKPLDTVAREAIAQIHGRSTYRTNTGESLDYLQAYLSLHFNTRDWNEEPFILFSYRPLKVAAGLNPERKYFSFAELMRSRLSSFVLQARQAENEGRDLSRENREALTLENRLALMLETVGQDRLPLIPHPSDRQGTWTTIAEASPLYPPSQLDPIRDSYADWKQTYQRHPEALNSLGESAQHLQDRLRNLSPQVYPNTETLQRETNFYRLKPFRKAWMLYAIAFAILLLVTLLPSLNFYWGSLGIFAVGLFVQGVGFWERMQIAGRPPVTNMYESVVWVGFGIAAIAFLFELLSRAKYPLLAASPLAIACLLLADSLPAVLDPSIKPLVPVLRDNFWLSIHVPTITLGYASFALALGLGHLFLGFYLFAPEGKERIRSLAKWNYGVLQVGVLLLATGIILGGIWAHFSWGRFWGWDPKETWALIALICYVVPLHGRLIGWLKDFGLAVTSIVSFNAVLMAWYGVNFVLGTGLHSYGFSTGGSEAIVFSLVGLDLLFVLVAARIYRQRLGVQERECDRAFSLPQES